MIWNERVIATAIARQTLARKCIVLVDNCNWTGHECDVLAVTMDMRVIDVEVKISRADLKADAKKDKWWFRGFSWRPWMGETRPEPLPRSHPPKVWKHYYAMPAEIWDDKLLAALPSDASGILLLHEQTGTTTVAVSCKRRAKPAKDCTRLKPEQALDIARLANLRMWDAYERAAKVAA